MKLVLFMELSELVQCQGLRFPYTDFATGDFR